MNSRGISGLRLDQKGRVWCYNFSGQVFYVQNDSLRLFKDYSRVCKSYPRFTFDASGNTWITADQLIEIFSPDGKLLRTINNYTDRKQNKVSWTELESQGAFVYIHSVSSGLWAFQDVHKQPVQISTVEQETQIRNRGAFRFIDSVLYLFIEINPNRKYQLYKVSPHELSYSNNIDLQHPADILYSVASDGCGGAMALSSAGALRMNRAMQKKQLPLLFAGEKISDMLIDREGSYWFCSLQSGIMVIPSIDLELHNHSNSGLPQDNISTLKAISPEELLLGTYKGSIYTFNKTSGTVRLMQNNTPELYRHVRKIKTHKGITYAARSAFSMLKNGHEEILRVWNARDFDFMDDSVYFMIGDQVLCAKPDASQKPLQVVTQIRPKGGSAIVCDTMHHAVYFACNDGLFKREHGTAVELKYNNRPVYASSLQLFQDELWVGSIADGVLKYNTRENRFTGSINIQSGLCSNSIRLMQVSKTGAWIITENCLNLVKPNGGIVSYSLAEGLLSKQINAIEVIADTAWIATNKGLIKMPVTLKASNQVAPSVNITGFVVNDQPIPISDTLRFLWNQNDIRISFEGIALRSRGSFYYKYRLNGNDTGWTFAGSEANSVRYNAMAPGNYQFEVICINEDGVESKPAMVAFGVTPPYWQSWWFYILLLVAVSAGVYLVFNIRLRLLKKRADERNQLVLSQLTALKAQMNPHFMYNTLNSIQDLMIRQDIKNTNYYLSQFGSLMRKVLDASGDEEILMSEELDMLKLYLTLEKLRFGEQFTFITETDPSIDPERIFIPSMIIQPFVENAIKHGLLHKRGAKQLKVSFRKENNLLLCTITDNGVGREKAAEIKARAGKSHRSFATSATEQRLSLINKSRQDKITLDICDLVENGQPTGTEVLIRIPLNPS